jgi:glucose-1-phosphate cytidylyltransferase
MKRYASFGFTEFVICLGYKGDVIKDYFLDYRAHLGSLTVDLNSGNILPHNTESRDNWKVHLLETGLETLTGGRIKRAAQFLDGRAFMATYGDGVADINPLKLLEFHQSSGKKATITAVRPPARFGGLRIENGTIVEFEEKPQVGEGWINGGFMVLESEIQEYIAGDSTILEREPLENLASEGNLGAYKHDGFWQCMDTVRDLTYLRQTWDQSAPPWKSW